MKKDVIKIRSVFKNENTINIKQKKKSCDNANESELEMQIIH